MTATHSGHVHPTKRSRPFAEGLTAFAAVMLMIAGVLDVCRGIMAIAEDDVFVATSDYVFQFDLTGWGWVHLALGAVAVLVSLGLFQESLWARVAGVAIAALIIIANFLSLPYYPVWSIVMIAFSAFIIWALCVAKRDDSGARSADPAAARRVRSVRTHPDPSLRALASRRARRDGSSLRQRRGCGCGPRCDRACRRAGRVWSGGVGCDARAGCPLGAVQNSAVGSPGLDGVPLVAPRLASVASVPSLAGPPGPGGHGREVDLDRLVFVFAFAVTGRAGEVAVDDEAPVGEHLCGGASSRPMRRCRSALPGFGIYRTVESEGPWGRSASTIL